LPCRRWRSVQRAKTERGAEIAVLESEVQDLKAKHAYVETVAARLEAQELRKNQPIQITAEKGVSMH